VIERRRRWVARAAVAALLLVAVVLATAVGALLYLHIPSNASGMAAESVCSAAFMGGRQGDAKTLMKQDVLPASPVLTVVSTSVDSDGHTVTGRFLGLFPRTASLVSDRGCVLDLPADPSAQPYVPAAPDPAPWPRGDSPVSPGAWPDGSDPGPLQRVVDDALQGSGDPTLANARGVAVVQDGRLLVQRDGKDIAPNTALHGWSMTKTVAAMLAWKRFGEVGLPLDTPVVDAFPDGAAPSWVAQWRGDDRSRITVADLVFMRPGLAIDESYDPWGSVVQMLYGEPDMSSWAADHPTDHDPGTHWEYLSAVSNILAQVVRAQFPDDASYWSYPRTALFGPIGATSAQLATDTHGNWVGSSYLWASAGDWARLGQVMLDDGAWRGRQVLPAGWWRLAGTPAVPDGEGHGYGAQTWIPADPVGGECRGTPGVPADTLTMEGHWGQVVAMIPSRNAVVVRLGWTFDEAQFDACRFVSDVVAALPRS
jgi:CubicO group peptidase (beta-lactamase class C family)